MVGPVSIVVVCAWLSTHSFIHAVKMSLYFRDGPERAGFALSRHQAGKHGQGHRRQKESEPQMQTHRHNVDMHTPILKHETGKQQHFWPLQSEPMSTDEREKTVNEPSFSSCLGIALSEGRLA